MYVKFEYWLDSQKLKIWKGKGEMNIHLQNKVTAKLSQQES